MQCFLYKPRWFQQSGFFNVIPHTGLWSLGVMQNLPIVENNTPDPKNFKKSQKEKHVLVIRMTQQTCAGESLFFNEVSPLPSNMNNYYINLVTFYEDDMFPFLLWWPNVLCPDPRHLPQTSSSPPPPPPPPSPSPFSPSSLVERSSFSHSINQAVW